MTDNSSPDRPDQNEKGAEWPLTVEDMYGPSKSTDSPLVYEETPIIEPIYDEAIIEKENKSGNKTSDTNLNEVKSPSPVTYTKPSRAPQKNIIVNIFFLTLLFGLGFMTSIYLRSTVADIEFSELKFPSFSIPKFSSQTANNKSEIQIPTLTPVPTSEQIVSTPTTVPESTISSGWVTYEIVSGLAKSPIAGLHYSLPNSVTAPACNQTSCISLGTNLPAGTRLTIAPRGVGFALPDPSGSILTDASGKNFIMKELTIAGFKATEFIADFSGSTLGGYGFKKMRGYMIKVNDKLTVEFSHFSPSSGTSDFDADDKLFNEIIASFKYTSENTPGSNP